jgi:hypothetical protein
MAGGGFAQTLRGNCLIMNIVAQLDNQACEPAADGIRILKIGTQFRYCLDRSPNGQSP